MRIYCTTVLIVLVAWSCFISTYADSMETLSTDKEVSTTLIQVLELRLDRQKTEKNKTRLLTLSLKQYRLKLLRAEKSTNIHLVWVYQEVIKNLEIQLWITIPISSTGIVIESTGSMTSTGTTPLVQVSPLSSAEEMRMSQVRTEVKNMYNANGGSTQSKSFFIRYFASEYGENSYNYKYATSLEFKKD